LRKSKEEAARTREAIVAAASDLIRKRGVAASSLNDMMAAAGLTHGGFYRHFQDKEHLVAEALRAAGDEVVGVVSCNLHGSGRKGAIASYLSTAHRDAAVPTCLFAALGSELRRSGKDIKGVTSAVLERLLQLLATDGDGRETSRSQAIVTLSTMVGAMVLARITADQALSSEILACAKEHLLE
jgi:TetR/AcrR family transcriptional repressor of nem operon